MTNRIKTTLAAGLVALTVAAVGPLAMAQDGQGHRRGAGPGIGGPGMPGMRGGPMMGLRGLDLTEAQQGQIKAISDSHRDEVRAAGQKIGTARQAMQALVEADQIDESAIRAKSVEVAAAEAEAAIIQARVRQQIFGILTPEQLQKAKENGPRKRRGV